ncbi:MAG TPA: CSLREA domain-containing protein, partial [Anaerolineales bacterium]|nr:CSLREA domain-containing protein [Anaerolineales bacterium]
MFARSIRLISMALLLSLGVTALQPVRPAYAAGYIVNTLTDENNSGDGLCSLREAVTAADNAGNGDCGANSPNSDV